MIVWLASFPRSGNTYVRILLYHVFGQPTFSKYDDPLLDDIGASQEVGHRRLPSALPELVAQDGFFFVKTHDRPEDFSPAVYIVRDGRDALVSYARYSLSFKKKKALGGIKEMVSGDGFRRELKKLILDDRYGGWGGNVLAWAKRSTGSTFTIKYEDLVADPVPWVSRALKTLGIALAPKGGRLPGFDELNRKWPQFFRKGKIGGWKDEMPPDLHDLFWERHAEAMRTVGYAR